MTAQDKAMIAARPYRLRSPAGANDSNALPLIVVLHGFGATAQSLEQYTKVTQVADADRVILAMPDGTRDSNGSRFWNATDSCCNFDHMDVDDVSYLRAIIKDAVAQKRVDAKRIYMMGFSNGGFMTLRAACELSDVLAAAVSVSGAGWSDANRCKPTSPISILQVHGDQDPTIPYGGGHPLGKAEVPECPRARKTVADWARRNGCGPNPSPGPVVDLDDGLAGAETAEERYSGCTRGAVELWTMHGGKHIIGFGQKAIHAFFEFLLAHPKP